MAKTWRLLDLPADSYAESTPALSSALMRTRKEGLVPDAVAVFTFRRPSIVMGYSILHHHKEVMPCGSSFFLRLLDS